MCGNATMLHSKSPRDTANISDRSYDSDYDRGALLWCYNAEVVINRCVVSKTEVTAMIQQSECGESKEEVINIVADE